MRPRAHLVRLLRLCYPNRRTTPSRPAGRNADGRSHRGPGSAILVPALVAGMLAPAVSQARGRSPLVVARAPMAHSAARALASAAALPTPPTTTTAAATASKVSASGRRLNSILGISSQDLALTKGKTLHLGAVLPLTGPGAEYGVYQGNGLKLAVEQIEQAGGPKIDLTR